MIPFSSLIGLEECKLALVLSIIDPRIGGVLISGPKGTGKSSLVRSLYSILPDVNYVENCQFHCNPYNSALLCSECLEKRQKGDLNIKSKQISVITLPLGATEDRVIGSLDIEKIIGAGIEALSPGILALANQEILYIDEINLLPDHLVDTILDCAASGWNIVERENISVRHPSQFILIGTMNPEEGDLRPQLLDRLSLFAQAGNIHDLNDRIKIIELNLQQENKELLFSRFKDTDEKIKSRIKNARLILEDVILTKNHKTVIANLCMALKVDGFRGDIVLARASRAKAAYDARKEVSFNDILDCAFLALLHRTREGGMREPPSRIEISKLFSEIIEALKK
ncbi:MAG: magnesium chelatase [Candidatus Heimdallarchaeota archaeon]|nr:magnesium chelatase [Candidatus Heimdallarchaeota archaeon]